MTIELHLPFSQSLKDRRSVMNSLKTRVRQRFNVSVAEADVGDLWQRAGLIISAAGSDAARVERVLHDVAGFVEQDERVHVMMPRMRFYE